MSALTFDSTRGEEPAGPGPAAIVTRALRKVYAVPGARAASAGATGIEALAGLDLEVGAGEFFGLLGPNGAGKTTTIGILTTRVLPTAGQAFVAGADVVREDVAVRRRIGVVPQRPDRKSTRLNSSHSRASRMPSSA